MACQHTSLGEMTVAFRIEANYAGERVNGGKARISGNQMFVPLRAGGAGTDHVNWHVISVDTHTTEGSTSPSRSASDGSRRFVDGLA